MFHRIVTKQRFYQITTPFIDTVMTEDENEESSPTTNGHI